MTPWADYATEEITITKNRVHREYFYHNFLTLLIMLDDNLIRSKVEQLAVLMYHEETVG